MNDSKKRGPGRRARVALSLILVGLYAAGMIAMIASAFRVGLYLWVFSTVGGIGLLYWIRTMDKREADAEAVAKGMPYGEPDDPTEAPRPVVPEDAAEAPGEGDVR